MPDSYTVDAQMIERIAERHTQQWHSTSDEVWGRAGFCAECQVQWPCDVAVLQASMPRSEQASLLALTQVGRLRDLVRQYGPDDTVPVVLLEQIISAAE